MRDRPRKCAYCGEAMPPASPTGRPAAYCSTGCRRAIEYERRRVDGALRTAEAEEQVARRLLLYPDGSGYGRLEGRQRTADWWAQEVERLRRRLRDLLDVDDLAAGDAAGITETEGSAT